MIVLLLAALALLVVGVVLLALAIVTTVGLGALGLALGLVSTSTFVGLSKRSFGAGFEAFSGQMGALIGMPCGVLAGWGADVIARTEFGLDPSRTMSLILGGVSGVAVGALLGFLSARAVRLMARWVRWKLAPPGAAPQDAAALRT